MLIPSNRPKTDGRRGDIAFSIVEVLVAVAVVGILFVSLYTGFASGFALVQLARENLRATQILQEKMETIRLYNWEQLNTPGFLPSTFKAPFYTTNVTTTASSGEGFDYDGILIITNAPITESYSNLMRKVIVKVSWVSGNVKREREMETFVARYGLQNYIY